MLINKTIREAKRRNLLDINHYPCMNQVHLSFLWLKLYRKNIRKAL